MVASDRAAYAVRILRIFVYPDLMQPLIIILDGLNGNIGKLTDPTIQGKVIDKHLIPLARAFLYWPQISPLTDKVYKRGLSIVYLCYLLKLGEIYGRISLYTGVNVLVYLTAHNRQPIIKRTAVRAIYDAVFMPLRGQYLDTCADVPLYFASRYTYLYHASRAIISLFLSIVYENYIYTHIGNTIGNTLGNW